MKLYILTTVLIVIVIVMQRKYTECAKKQTLADVREMLKPIGKTCRTKTKVSDEIVAACPNGEFPKIRPLMCYFKCIMTMMKVMNKEGQISLKVINNQIDSLIPQEFSPRMKEISQICMDSVPFKEDSCEYAYDMVLCGYNLENKIYILP